MINFDRVLNDPQLGAQTLTLTRIDQDVDGHGRAADTEETATAFTGIVTQDTGSILERLAGDAYVSGSILVTTSTALRIDGPDVEADVIVWNGKRYNVNKISDYTLHGVNWAVCNPDGVRA